MPEKTVKRRLRIVAKLVDVLKRSASESAMSRFSQEMDQISAFTGFARWRSAPEKR